MSTGEPPCPLLEWDYNSGCKDEGHRRTAAGLEKRLFHSLLFFMTDTATPTKYPAMDGVDE